MGECYRFLFLSHERIYNFWFGLYTHLELIPCHQPCIIVIAQHWCQSISYLCLNHMYHMVLMSITWKMIEKRAPKIKLPILYERLVWAITTFETNKKQTHTRTRALALARIHNSKVKVYNNKFDVQTKRMPYPWPFSRWHPWNRQ